MGEKTGIAWTDSTFSPWWGCTHVSEACQNCYAEAWAKRCGHDCFGKGKPRRTFDRKHWIEPLKWNQRAFKLGEKHKVFSSSMCDVFDEEGPKQYRDSLFGTIINTPNLIWILCTKRPQNIPRMVPPYWMESGFPENVWMLITAENQKRADERIPHILPLPVSVRGLSIEPMLGQITLERDMLVETKIGLRSVQPLYVRSENGIGKLNWVIVGGESGPEARPMHPTWVRSIRDQCREAGVPFFLKQWGEWLPFSTSYPGIEWSKLGTGEILSVKVDGKRYWNALTDEDEQTIYVRVGKKKAGRTIDGSTWSKFPEVK